MNRLSNYFKNSSSNPSKPFDGEICFVNFRNDKVFYLFFITDKFSPIFEDNFIQAITDGHEVKFVLRNDNENNIAEVRSSGENALRALELFKKDLNQGNV